MAAEGEGNVIIDTPPSKGVYVEGINVGATLQHLIATISELSSDVNRLQQEGTNLRSKLREAEIRINGLEQQ